MMNFLNKVFAPKLPIVSLFMPRLAAETVHAARFSIFSHKISETTKFLLPQNVTFTPLCGLKIKGQMRRRCKDCYYVRKEGRLYIMCNSFPRHKQTHMVKREKFTWIFSHACQSPLRPY